MSSYQELIDRQKTFVSQKIPKVEKKLMGISILQEVACMSPKYRKVYGFIKAFKELTGNDRLDRFLKPIQILGLSQKIFSELSELGFKLGEEEGYEILDLEGLGIIKS